MKNEKTKKALSSLEWAIAQTIKEPKSPDEFTAEEFSRACNLSSAQTRGKLSRMVERGQLTKRKISICGNQVNLYQKPN